jgi:hypothetical protein
MAEAPAAGVAVSLAAGFFVGVGLADGRLVGYGQAEAS